MLYRTREAAELAACRTCIETDVVYCDIATRALIVRNPVTRASGKVYVLPRSGRDKAGRRVTGYIWEVGA